MGCQSWLISLIVTSDARFQGPTIGDPQRNFIEDELRCLLRGDA
jgi:hypothetical protein